MNRCLGPETPCHIKTPLPTIEMAHCVNNIGMRHKLVLDEVDDGRLTGACSDKETLRAITAFCVENISN